MKQTLCIMIVLTCLGWSCRHAIPEESPTMPVRVKVVQVTKSRISIPVRTSGIVTSSRETRLSFKTGGIIAHINVEDGDQVKRGDVLATLNLSEIQSQVIQVKNGYEKALRDFNRVKNLYADSVATLEQLQNAETGLNVARANLDMAQFNLDHSRIIAPDDGTILKRLAETNEVIAPGYPVFVFGTDARFWKIKTGLADRDFVRISPGDSARVTLDAWPDVVFTAMVSQISESANPLTGTYEVELELRPNGYKLASGFVANVEIHPSKRQSFFVIPVEALVQAEGHTGYVYVVNDSMIARRVKVEVSAVYGSDVSISRGLEKVTGVVTEGAPYLSEGDRVEIIN
jgi:membrane fusion protein, multidrug efflux system